jgi:hypothetical protein
MTAFDMQLGIAAFDSNFVNIASFEHLQEITNGSKTERIGLIGWQFCCFVLHSSPRHNLGETTLLYHKQRQAMLFLTSA